MSLQAEFLHPPAQPTVVEQFQAADWALDFHEAHVKARVRGPLPSGWVSLGLMRGAAETRWHGYKGGRGLLVCLPPGESLDGCIVPGFSSMSANVPLAVWERCRAVAGGEHEGLRGVVAYQLAPEIFTRIEARLHTVRRQLREASRLPASAPRAATAATALADSLFTTVWELSAGAVPRGDSYRNRARLARRAEDWMRAHLAEPIRVPDVCLALRVSRRELEYAFRAVFDQSPRDFLQALRLNAIRRALRSRPQPLTTLAFDCGITHLSRFAAEYRSLFGENPSQTAARI